MDLSVLFDPKLDPARLMRLATVLDELGHGGRVWAMGHLGTPKLAQLFEATGGVRALTLDHLVPAGVAPMTETVHEGRNTLPAFNHFAKVFCRESEALVGGYNRQSLLPVTGPGYFVAYASPDAAGELLIDYRRIPSNTPSNWPTLAPNTGLAGVVYGGMVDVLRGVSDHVAIGRAKKGVEWLDVWFALVRTPPAS